MTSTEITTSFLIALLIILFFIAVWFLLGKEISKWAVENLKFKVVICKFLIC